MAQPLFASIIVLTAGNYEGKKEEVSMFTYSESHI